MLQWLLFGLMLKRVLFSLRNLLKKPINKLFNSGIMIISAHYTNNYFWVAKKKNSFTHDDTRKKNVFMLNCYFVMFAGSTLFSLYFHSVKNEKLITSKNKFLIWKLLRLSLKFLTLIYFTLRLFGQANNLLICY